jgi:hypothetical protein
LFFGVQISSFAAVDFRANKNGPTGWSSLDALMDISILALDELFYNLEITHPKRAVTAKNGPPGRKSK